MARKLTQEEIEILEKRGCEAEEWGKIEVADAFRADRVRNTRLMGECYLGNFESEIEIEGVRMPSGVYDSLIIDSRIEDGALVMRTGAFVANMAIGKGAAAVNCGTVACEKGARYGIGTQVAVLNENGGRSVSLALGLDAQTAYIATTYRHDKTLCEKINRDLVRETEDALGISDDGARQGYIGEGARVISCKEVRNVWIGDYATAKGCEKICEGIVASRKDEPTRIDGATMRCFVCAQGSEIANGAIVERCFIGEGTQMGNGFSATDCIFCSNCQMFHGEACSLLAGPFSVSHHKSTLLIAAMTSFMNAGSNSNQSNHYYRLGPNHEGKLGRGSKTASGSYILWPSVTGAFTMVKGKHGGNLDTRSLPFSYLIEQGGETWIYPAYSIKSSGTARDITKWQRRDKRKKVEPCRTDAAKDQIDFDICSPYILKQVSDGIALLRRLEKHQRKAGINYHKYGRAKIHCGAVSEGLDLYNLFMSAQIGKMLEGIGEREFREFVRKNGNEGEEDRWCDVLGVFVPTSALTAALEDYKNGDATLSRLRKKTADLYTDGKRAKQEWCAKYILINIWGGDEERITDENIESLREDGRKAQETLNELVEADKEREYSEFMQVGYGMDFGAEEKEADFKNTQGIG